MDIELFVINYEQCITLAAQTNDDKKLITEIGRELGYIDGKIESFILTITVLSVLDFLKKALL